jgi:hypothetical protein
MNEKEAADLAISLNETLAASLADSVIMYKVFALWTINYEKVYNVILIPAGLNAAFNDADYSQQLAFARVSLLSQLGAPTTLESFVNNFTSNAEKDSELDDYLNK